MTLAKTNDPPSPPNKKEPYWYATEGREWMLWLVELIGLFVLAYYACTTAKMYQEIAGQTKIARSTFEANERPRVIIDDKEGKGISVFLPAASNVARTGLEFRLAYSLQNLGRSPTDVVIKSKAVNKYYYPGSDELHELVRATCETDWPTVNSPKFRWPATFVTQMAFGTYPILDINDATRKDGFVTPTVVGCIWYRSSIETKTIYKTPFAVQLSMSKDAAGHAVKWNPEKIPILANVSDITAIHFWIMDGTT